MTGRKKPTSENMVFPSRRHAQSFCDVNAVQFFDPDHSENEDRFILLEETEYWRLRK